VIVHPLTAHDLAKRADLTDRTDIELLVRSFYRYAAMDELLGPIFSAAHVDWPSHIDTLTRFWAWQLLGERGYVGNPLRAHEPVHARTPFSDTHFARWLELFTTTVDEHFIGPTAEMAKQRAAKMAHALQRLLADEQHDPSAPMEPMWTTGTTSNAGR
jgi:hemoglobin